MQALDDFMALRKEGQILYWNCLMVDKPAYRWSVSDERAARNMATCGRALNQRLEGAIFSFDFVERGIRFTCSYAWRDKPGLWRRFVEFWTGAKLPSVTIIDLSTKT